MNLVTISTDTMDVSTDYWKSELKKRAFGIGEVRNRPETGMNH